MVKITSKLKELEKIGESLEADILKEDLKEVTEELSNMLISQVGENIPGVGIFFKTIKAIGSVKDYVLMTKVVAFLGELDKMSASSRKSLVDKINSDRIYGQRFGAYLISAIDRHEFAHKSVFLARICKYYERGDISKPVLIKLNSVIENMHLEDILEWMQEKYSRTPDSEDHPAFNSFLSNGIIKRQYKFDKLMQPQNTRHPWDRVPQARGIITTKMTSLGSGLYSILKNEELLWYIKDELCSDKKDG